MSQNNGTQQGKKMTFHDLCNDYSIVIPRMQRDYAQGRCSNHAEAVRDNFLNALHNALEKKEPISLDFIYGSVEDGRLTLLDGQQRITTLFLLHWYAAFKEDKGGEADFLGKFTYETRPCSEKFCKKLVKGISKNDISQIKFSGMREEETLSGYLFEYKLCLKGWKKDPTVESMLTMLDAIHKKFRDVGGLWDKLLSDDRLISFYFMEMKDMRLTDDLYIKMNARGKPLTTFEIFKAELEKCLRGVPSVDSKAIISKIDGAWTDMIWPYAKEKEDDHTIDNRFLRYFRFVCDILLYTGKGKPDEEVKQKTINSDDVIALAREYFSVASDAADEDRKRVKHNIDELENFFDCWCVSGEESTLKKLGFNDAAAFFHNYTASEGYKKDKIQLFMDKKSKDDLLRHCLDSYDTQAFDFRHRVLLYACVRFLNSSNGGKDKITNFPRRLRILNNLSLNTHFEADKMRKVIEQTDYILWKKRDASDEAAKDNPEIIQTKKLGEVVFIGGEHFDQNQRKEENLKLKWCDAHTEEEQEKLFELEDHPLLYGQVGVTGILDDLGGVDDGIDPQHRAELFNTLLPVKWEDKCEGKDKDKYEYIEWYDLLNCALLVSGYEPAYVGGNKYQMLSASNKETWETLFHKSSNGSIDSMKKAVKAVLIHFKDDKNVTKKSLKALIEDAKSTKREEHACDWKYYYVSYKKFRETKYGKYYWNWGETSSEFDTKSYPAKDYILPKTYEIPPYEMFVMKTQNNWVEVSASQPFLEALSELVKKKEGSPQSAPKMEKKDYRSFTFEKGQTKGDITCENESFVLTVHDGTKVMLNEDNQHDSKKRVDIEEKTPGTVRGRKPKDSKVNVRRYKIMIDKADRIKGAAKLLNDPDDLADAVRKARKALEDQQGSNAAEGSPPADERVKSAAAAG